MSGIQVSELGVATVESSLRGGVGDYCSFDLVSLHGAIPVAGSARHDGQLRGLMRGALSSYESMISSDVFAAKGAHDALAKTDALVAANL